MPQKHLKPLPPKTQENLYNSGNATFSPEINARLLEQDLSQAWISLGYSKKDLKEVQAELAKLTKLVKPTSGQIALREKLSAELKSVEEAILRKKDRIRQLLALKK